MITGHDVDCMVKTPETLSQRSVFRAILIKTKDSVEHGNIIPSKSDTKRNIPAASEDFHFLSQTHYWHSWQHSVIKKSEVLQRPIIQRLIKRFLRQNNFSLQSQVNSSQEELKVKFISFCLFVF